MKLIEKRIFFNNRLLGLIFADRTLLQQNVPFGGGLLSGGPTNGHLLPTAADGIPDGGTHCLGSRIPGDFNLVCVYRVRVEEVVRAIDGAQDLQDTTGLGFRMTGWRGGQGERTVPEEEEGQQGEEGAEGTCGVSENGIDDYLGIGQECGWL